MDADASPSYVGTQVAVVDGPPGPNNLLTFQVRSPAGKIYPDLIVSQASQEHGILATRSGSKRALPDLSVGAKVRILPNHACATASQHELYNVLSARSDAIHARWPRMRGW